ncbi:MAG: ligase-associated DNA damage response endonuclease PdeM [Verrucomicrobiota bacterium]
MNPFPNHSSLTLLPEGAVFLKNTSTLVVADIHLGKSAAFRSHGLPVPEGDTAHDLLRLIELSRNYQAAHLVIAGDLFHSPSGITSELKTELRNFLTELGVPLTLVVGNHDVRIAPMNLPFSAVPHLDPEENIRIIHDPADIGAGKFHISGHWHPVVKISDGRRPALRLKCFVCRNETLVLPAFGSFTGGTLVHPLPDDRLFVALRATVLELPQELV